jgi:hypothetical protein
LDESTLAVVDIVRYVHRRGLEAKLDDNFDFLEAPELNPGRLEIRQFEVKGGSECLNQGEFGVATALLRSMKSKSRCEF